MMNLVVKALLFDVQGTATDFHSTVCDEGRRIGAGRYPAADWPDVVRRWRAGYFSALEAAQTRGGGWVSVHSVYRRALDTVLDERGLSGLTDAERDELTLVPLRAPQRQIGRHAVAGQRRSTPCGVQPVESRRT